MSSRCSRAPGLLARPLLVLALLGFSSVVRAQDLEVIAVEGQPLAANVERVVRALESLGAPLPPETTGALVRSGRARDARAIQQQLDTRVLLVVTINPEERVKVGARSGRGGPPAERVHTGAGQGDQSRPRPPRHCASRARSRAWSRRARSVLSMKRQDQRHLKVGEVRGGAPGRFLQVEMVTAQPMTPSLSGLGVEYALALVYSSESGHREATIGFDVGQGTQDLGFRGEMPVLFDVRPAIPVRLRVRDLDGAPTVAHFTFTDRSGHIHPPQSKRTAPDLFFQRQVYRADGGVVLLPPGPIDVTYGRGPEYRQKSKRAARSRPWRGDARSRGSSGGSTPRCTASTAATTTSMPPAVRTTPTRPRGSSPKDIFLQVKGEGLNVGCVLTWGPCYDYQRRFFGAAPRRAERAADPDQVRRRGQRLRLAGAGARLPARTSATRPTLAPTAPRPKAGRRGPRPCCAGRRPRGPSRATPTPARASRSSPRPPRSGCWLRLDRDADGSLTPSRQRGACCRPSSPRPTPTATACSAVPSSKPPTNGLPTRCRTLRSRR